MRYMPQSAQAPVHQAQTNLIVVNGGEGSGKSNVTAAEIAGRYGLWDLVHFVCYKYESATNEGDYLAEYLRRIGALANYARPKQGKLQIVTRSGGVVESVSTEKEGEQAVTGTGKSPDIIAMIEAGKQTYAVFLACLVRISRKGGLFIISGTVENSEPWYPELINSVKGDNQLGATLVTIPAWENHILYPGGRDDPKIKLLEATLPADKFKERIAGETVPLSGLVFKEFAHLSHVKHAPYWTSDKDWIDAPVELAIDPGYAGAYAVCALQWRGDLVHQIDEVYYQYRVAEDVIDECMDRPWWHLVSGAVMDVAGRQHVGLTKEEQTHKQIWSQRARLKDGRALPIRDNRVGIAAGITRHRTFLINPFGGKPRLFHDPRCKQTIREYGQYKYKDLVDGKPVDETPIDANNHAMKALAYWLYDKFGAVDKTVSAIRHPQPAPFAFLK